MIMIFGVKRLLKPHRIYNENNGHDSYQGHPRKISDFKKWHKKKSLERLSI